MQAAKHVIKLDRDYATNVNKNPLKCTQVCEWEAHKVQSGDKW